MKKHEKVLTGIFTVSIALFIADFFYEVIYRHVEADYHFFGGITLPLSIMLIISVFGLMTLLTNVWLRKRSEAGEAPISKAYTASFILSFVPFVLLVIYSASTGEFTFMGSVVSTGSQAFLDTLFFTGIFGLCIIVPLFPVLIYWQILYLVNRVRYKKKAEK